MTQLFQICRDFGELNVNERLNYVLGQVLGVKDFQQEQAYFLHKSRLHNRSLHGYGTVWGLDVQTDGSGDTLEIQVQPGLAIDTRGREVLVNALQCANLNTWLGAASAGDSDTPNHATLQPAAEGESAVAVYVTLCYRACETGAQPILGNPCRTDSGEEGVIQYTRIRDDFELRLTPAPPNQQEEDRVRAIGELLAAIDIDPDANPLSDDAAAALLQSLRDALDDPGLIPELPEVILPEVQARDILRRLFRTWVTTTRPALDNDTAEDECILLAAVQFELTASNTVDEEAGLVVENLQRPYLLHTRLLQELLLRGGIRGPQGEPGADGAAATIEVGAVTTGDPGTDASVTNSGTDTNAVLDFVIPRGADGTNGTDGEDGDDGVAATIEVGTVTTGDPGTDASVTNSGTDTNAVLDFTIPRGDPGVGGSGGGWNQIIVPPTDMLPYNNSQNPQLIANAEVGSGYPVQMFRDRGIATFSIPRPASTPEVVPPPMFLRLYATTELRDGEDTIVWGIRWRWVRAIGPLATRAPFNEPAGTRSEDFDGTDETALLPMDDGAGFGDTRLQMPVRAGNGQLHLNISEPIPLAPPDTPADYLAVYLEMAEAGSLPVYLLMAELRWRV